MRLDKHPIIKKCYDVMQAIEVCGASIELTHAGTLAGQLGEDIDNLVDQLQLQESINSLEKLQIKKDDLLIFKSITSRNINQLRSIAETISSHLNFKPLIILLNDDFTLEKMPVDQFYQLMKLVKETRGLHNENSTEIEKDNT